MKSLLAILSVLTVGATVSANVVTTYIGINDPNIYLRSLGDYDWSSVYGDRMKFIDYQIKPVEKTDYIISQQKVRPDFDSDIIEYNNFNTGYQSSYEQTRSVDKQGVTGAPTSKIFMPNGNTALDFGVDNRAERFLKSNSFLTWDPKIDQDAKFNQVSPNDQADLKRGVVGAKWVPTQSDEIRTSYLGFTSVAHRSPVSSGIEMKNPWNNNFSSYQYVDKFIDWGGSFFEGLIKIPSSEAIEAAHLNGSKSYATVFLDSFHGLTKSMLKDFVKKDSNGNFLISSILLKMADYFGFDGYFWNYESNGSLPNGTISDNRDIIQIFKEVKELQKTYTNPRVRNLEQIFYSSFAKLTYNKIGVPNNTETYEMAKVADEITLDFGERPELLDQFITDRQDWKDRRLQIYNIVEMSHTAVHGFTDIRFLTGKWSDENHVPYSDRWNSHLADQSANEKMTFSNDVLASISLYEDEGGDYYADAAFNQLPNVKAWQDHVKDLTSDQQALYANLFAQQVNNVFEDLIYTGRNRFLRMPAKEASPTKEAKYNGKIHFDGPNPNDYYIDAVVDEDYGITNRGWNSQWKDMFPINIIQGQDVIPDLEVNMNNLTNDEKRWLYAKDANGNYVYSFGVGAMVQEKTLLTSENFLAPTFKFATNFSTGSGIQFIDKNDYVWSNYPWSDKRMMDVTPTYRWDVRKLNQTDLSKPVEMHSLKNFAQNQISGFFDYFNVYEKGNSIALANKLNYDGSLKGIHFDEPILWNIMGTNFKPSETVNRNFSLAFQANKTGSWESDNEHLALENYPDLKLAVSVVPTSDDSQEEVYFLPLTVKPSTKHQGWMDYEISGADLAAQLPNNVIVAKLGLAISPTTNSLKDDVIFNVGHLEISSEQPKQIVELTKLDLNVEYLIDRKSFLNMRLNWNGSNNQDVLYYELYYLDEEKEEDTWWRLTQTTNDATFIKQLPNKQNFKIAFKPIYDQDNNNQFYIFEINR